MLMERRDRQNLNLVTDTHSTNNSGTNGHRGLYPNRWARIGFRARNKSFVFNNLLTHVNVNSLKEAFKAIDGSKDLGVDSISKTEYGKSLEENLIDLERRIKNGSYKPKPKREVLIPKTNGKTRLIGRFLKGELIAHNGEKLPSEIGTPQGSIMSPILANIYLDVVVDQWFIKNYASCNKIIVRYADDAVFFFKREDEAEKFLNDLEGRVSKYDLSLNMDKTHSVALAKKGNEQFNFLGFTFYWGKQGSRRILKLKTQKERLIRSIQEFDKWIKRMRNRRKLKDIWDLAKMKLRGHFNYYGYNMNALKLNHFYYEVTKSLFKWLNRRSQKRSYNWEGFKERLKNLPLIVPIKEMKLKQLGWNPYA